MTEPTHLKRSAYLAWALALTPLAIVAIQLALRGPGPDPAGALVRWGGRAALAMLLAALAPGALRRRWPWAGWGLLGRTLGLAAFGYALAHMALHLGLSYALRLSDWLRGLPSERFVLIGLGALAILAALAITSGARAQRRLGRAWRPLHRLVYLAGGLAVWHAAWAGKTMRLGVALTGVMLALLLLARLLPRRRADATQTHDSAI